MAPKNRCYRELAAIDQHTKTLEKEYGHRRQQAIDTRLAVYEEALEVLYGTDGWAELNEAQQTHVAAPLRSRASRQVPDTMTIPFLRAEVQACSQHLKHAILEMMTILDGNQVVTVPIGEFFPGRLETPEQLDAALSSLRARLEKLIGEGKKVLIQ